MMATLHAEFPAYGRNRTKAIPPSSTREAIEKHGPTIHHRKSFTLLPVQTELIFKSFYAYWKTSPYLFIQPYS